MRSAPMGPGPAVAFATAVVAAAVALVLALLTPLPAAALPAAAAPSHASRSDGCDPIALMPVRCGTWSTTYAGPALLGGRGGPPPTPLQLSFTIRDGRPVLLARGACLSAEVPMRAVTVRAHGTVQREFERAGAPRFTAAGCAAVADGWARRFLGSAVRTDDGQTFDGLGRDAVFTRYEGSAPLGAPQQPRNQLHCVPAGVAPFGCTRYRSTSGTGTLAFLGARHVRLDFMHLNGELTAGFFGACNAQSASVEVDGSDLVVVGRASTAMLCLGQRGEDDAAIADAVRGVVPFRLHGDVLVLTGHGGTAVFER